MLVHPLFFYEDVFFYAVDLYVDCTRSRYASSIYSVLVQRLLEYYYICVEYLSVVFLCFNIFLLLFCIDIWCCMFHIFLLLMYTAPVTVFVYLSSI